MKSALTPDFVSSLGLESDLAVAAVVAMVVFAIVVTKTGWGPLARAFKKGPEKQDVDLIAEIQRVAAEQLRGAKMDLTTLREQVNSQQTQLNSQGSRLSRQNDQLANQGGRIDALEDELSKARSKLSAAIAHIINWQRWERNGAKPPSPPIPPSLKEELDGL